MGGVTGHYAPAILVALQSAIMLQTMFFVMQIVNMCFAGL
jgi:hypothetical protein